MYVRDGDFIKYYFRPINMFFYFQSEVFDIKGLGQLAFGIATIVYSWHKLALPVTFIAILELIKTGEIRLTDDSTRDDFSLEGAA